MDNKLTARKDSFPISSIILALYLVLNFIFTIAIQIINYHENFRGMISNILSALPGLLITSAVIIAIIVLQFLKVRGPVLAIPFGVMALLCVINTISAILNFFAAIEFVPFFSGSASLVFSLIYNAVNLIAYLLIGFAAIKSSQPSKPLFTTLAAALFLTDTLVAPVSIFIQTFLSYIGWGVMPAIESACMFITIPSNIISMLSNFILGIIFAVGMFFLGIWMAKGKPQVEETAVVE